MRSRWPKPAARLYSAGFRRAAILTDSYVLGHALLYASMGLPTG